MTAYKLMIKTNHHLIKDGELTASQKDNIVRQFLAARSDERTKQSFYKSMGAGAGTYPAYYIPPYNGNKCICQSKIDPFYNLKLTPL